MRRGLIYFFPALIDFAMGIVFFVCPVRTANMGESPMMVANLATVWGAAYMISCLVVSRYVTVQNSVRLILTSCVSLVALSAALASAESLSTMYALMIPMGMAVALFFPPFQVFMKVIDQGHKKSVAYSTGLYTFAWSIGLATGMLSAGFVYAQYGWQACFAASAFAIVLTGIGVYRFKHLVVSSTAEQPAADSLVECQAALESSDDSPAGKAPIDYSRLPNFAWMAWLCGGIGVIAWGIARNAFPSSAKLHELTKMEQGTVLFILCSVQAVVGLALCRSRIWMYRALPLTAFGLFGFVSLIFFAMATEPNMYYTGAAFFGVYSGSFFFYFVFHSLIHPEKSGQYVSINESVVGICAIVGSWLAGMLGNWDPKLQAPYYAAAAAVALSVVLQIAVHRGKGNPAGDSNLRATKQTH